MNPVLCVPCGDLFHNATLLDAAMAGLNRIAEASKSLGICPIVGLPMRRGGAGIYNCAALVNRGDVEIVEKNLSSLL